MDNRAGIYKKNLSGEMAYKSLMPSILPPNPPIELNNEMVDLLVKANKQLALLEGISSRIPNIHLFISMCSDAGHRSAPANQFQKAGSGIPETPAGR